MASGLQARMIWGATMLVQSVLGCASSSSPSEPRGVNAREVHGDCNRPIVHHGKLPTIRSGMPEVLGDAKVGDLYIILGRNVRNGVLEEQVRWCATLQVVNSDCESGNSSECCSGLTLNEVAKSSCEVCASQYQIGPLQNWSRNATATVAGDAWARPRHKWQNWVQVDTNGDGRSELVLRHRCCRNDDAIERETLFMVGLDDWRVVERIVMPDDLVCRFLSGASRGKNASSSE